jgi:ATP-dependent Clp protease ATP-binding subunit ClpX
MGIIKDRLLGAVGRLAGDAESCAFCGKPADEVKHLIAGPRAMICDECVAICVAVLADQDAKPDL